MKMLRADSIIVLLSILLSWSGVVMAAKTTESFEIEGLITPSSPKTLIPALESQLGVKVVNFNLNDTDSGWPLIEVEYDSDSLSAEDISKAIAGIEDPLGHNYKVHTGPLLVNAKLTQEELDAITALAPTVSDFPKLENPIPASAESTERGLKSYRQNCSKCHGVRGNGYGPTVHAFTTWPRQLWAWGNADSSADGYLFGFISEGRSDMPPWGLILTENERWDLVNYIKTLRAPAN